MRILAFNEFHHEGVVKLGIDFWHYLGDVFTYNCAFIIAEELGDV